MSKVYKIGRLVQLGVAKESTRGTTPGSASYWPAYDGELVLDEVRKLVTDMSTYGIIEDAVGKQVVESHSEGTIKGSVTDTSFGLFLLSLFGTQTNTAHGYESVVYDTKFTVGESAQHQSLSFYIHDANVQDYSYANGMVSKLELTYELDKFFAYSVSIMAKLGVQQSAYSPSVTQENRFAAPYGTLSLAPTKAGLPVPVTGTGTAASTTALTAISGFTTDQISVGMLITGTNIAAGAYVTAIVSSSSLTMSSASTGNASDITIGGLIGTVTASSTASVTASSVNALTTLKIGMAVTGKYIPNGTTITAISSATAFTLSAATTGAADYVAFGGAIVPIKSAKVSFDSSVEAFMASGSASPVDFFNKEFKITGTIEAIYRDEDDFKTAFLAGTPYAALLSFTNTAVTIGTGANPACSITLDQIYFSKLVIKRSQKDIVYQTASFEATYSIANSEMANVVLTNLVSAY